MTEMSDTPRVQGASMGNLPDRLLMHVPGLNRGIARVTAWVASEYAKENAPKLSGASSERFVGVAGEDYFGVRWAHSYVWFQEAGINPFTMRSLAGKTIPMWVEDHDGEERRKNPRIQTRVTADGRTQVLIFRRAAQIGQRKMAWRRRGGEMRRVSVPASYPGAPGRINRRRGAGEVDEQGGRIGGQIARRNVGVRWRHPGLDPKNFIYKAMIDAAREYGLEVGPIVPTNADWS